MKREELLEYFKTERERSEKTRDIQWKFNIGIWTLLALGIGFLNADKVDSCKCMFNIAAILFVGCHLIFAYLTQRGLAGSRKLSDEILNALDNSQDEKFVKFPIRRVPNVSIGFFGWLWILFQIMGTAILVIVLFIRINHF